MLKGKSGLTSFRLSTNSFKINKIITSITLLLKADLQRHIIV